MADAQVLYAENTSHVTANSTTWVDVCEIAASSFTASKKYLILALGYLKPGNASAHPQLRLVHGTTPTQFTDALTVAEMSGSSRQCFGWMTVWDQPATAELVKVQLSDAATATATCELGQILAIKLDDDFTTDDWKFAEDLTDHVVVDATPIDGASVTFTANGTDRWLILGQTCWDQVNNLVGVGAMIDVDGTDYANWTSEVEAGQAFLNYLMMRTLVPSSGSHTAKVQMRRDHGTGTSENFISNRIFALNLGKFAQIAQDEDIEDYDPPDSGFSAGAPCSVGITPAATGQFVILAFGIFDHNTVNEKGSSRIQVNDGGGLASDPSFGDDLPNMGYNQDATEETPQMLFKRRTLTAGASRTVNYEWTSDGSTFTARIDVPELVVFSVALAGATTVTGSAAITGVGSQVAAALKEILAVSGVSGAGSASAVSLLEIPGVAAINGACSLIGAGFLIRPGVAAINGAGSVSAVAVLDVLAAAGIVGAGTASAGALLEVLAGANLQGVGAIVVTGDIASAIILGSASLFAAGSTTTFAQLEVLAASNIAVLGSVDGVPLLIIPGQAQVMGAAMALAGSLVEVLAQAGVSGVGALTSGALLEVMAAANLAGVGGIIVTGDVAGAILGSAALAGIGSAAATALLEIPAVALISGTGATTISGLVEVLATAGVGAAVTVTAAGEVIAIIAGSAVLSGAGALSAQGALDVLAVAAVDGVGGLTADSLVEVLAAAGITGTVAVIVSASVFGAFGAPTGLVATAVSESEIDLVWNAVLTADGYDIERDGAIIVVLNVPTDYADSGLAEGSEHTYRVRAARERV